MKSKLDFTVPFSGFTSTNFINCFASVYMFLEHITGVDEYECARRRGLPCDGCGRCQHSTAKKQERLYFLMDFLSGRSALRCRFDGQPSTMQLRVGETEDGDCGAEETVDFLFGYTGYPYRRVSDAAAFAEAIGASIAEGRPVLARVKQGKGRFRVITGIDGDTLLGPDYAQAQQPPQDAPALDDIEALYLIGPKGAPRYTLKDAFTRVRDIMRCNQSERLWEQYEGKLGWYESGGMRGVSPEERAERMRCVTDTMWYTFNCHNFAEVFRDPWLEEMRQPAFAPICLCIGPSYGYTHDLA